MLAHAPAHARRLRLLRNQGRKTGTAGLDHAEPGFNYRLSDIACALGRVQLSRLDEILTLRRQAAERYHALFRAAGVAESGPYPVHGVVLPHEVAGSHHVWHQYVIRTQRRDQLRAFLTERKIGSDIYYPVPLHQQAPLQHLGYREGSFPEAERAAREVLALPIFAEIRADEQQTVVDAIAQFLS